MGVGFVFLGRRLLFVCFFIYLTFDFNCYFCFAVVCSACFGLNGLVGFIVLSALLSAF